MVSPRGGRIDLAYLTHTPREQLEFKKLWDYAHDAIGHIGNWEDQGLWGVELELLSPLREGNCEQWPGSVRLAVGEFLEAFVTHAKAGDIMWNESDEELVRKVLKRLNSSNTG